MIIGRRVRLRQPERSSRDHEILVGWRNDPWAKAFFFEEEPISLESHLRWYDQVAQDRSQRYYVIDALLEPGTVDHACDPSVLIGTISLPNIDWRNRTAEYGRFLIGHPDYRGGGYGKEAEFLLMDYAFNHLNLNRVWGDVLAGNQVALELDQQMGFRQEGTLRQQVFKNGAYLDVIRVGLLAEDFRRVRDNLRR